MLSMVEGAALGIWRSPWMSVDIKSDIFYIITRIVLFGDNLFRRVEIRMHYVPVAALGEQPVCIG